MRSSLLVLALALIAAASLPRPVRANDCEALWREHRDPSLNLSYREFDQTDGAGFRELAERRCYARAADLIEEYIRVSGARQSSLRWHAAQMRASAGELKEAIRHARGVLLEAEDLARRPLRWNDYVLATIAFLEGDRSAFELHMGKVAEGREAHHGNELNLRLLERLSKNFDKSYAYALESAGE